MSFFLLLSIFPLLLFTMALIAYIPNLQLYQYINIIKGIIPYSSFDTLSSIINSSIDNRNISLIITSFFITLYSSSRVISSLVRIMNRSYKIKETRSYFLILFNNFVLIILILALILSSFVLLVYGEFIGMFIFKFIKLDDMFLYIWGYFRYLLGISIVFIILTILFMYAPNRKVRFKDVLPGAIIATLGWIFVSTFYSYYTTHIASYDLIYGSLSGIIILVTWLYLISFTIIVGCQINAKFYFRNKQRR